MQRIALFLLALLLPTGAGAAPPASCPSSELIACTQSGALRGTDEHDVIAFKGIPYAKPPVGTLRWRPPLELASWQGVREAAEYGPICPQIVDKEVVGDEDCLTLNVWKPKGRTQPLLPVMVWLTGGGNHAYSGRGTPGFGGVTYDGKLLAPEGVVFVSFNARLGVLGYLAHPALDSERKEHVSGNYGNLDQIAMLRWLQRNIDAFGGDPKRVFLFGTSAGGGNICALMTSPLARDLFHAASMQSSVPTGCEIQTLADAEQGTGKRVVDAVGCTDAHDVSACLRGKTVKEIVAAVPGTFGVLPRIYGPNMDGYVFPDQPLKRIARGQHQAMPVIIGNTAEETMQFVDAAGPVTDEASYAAAVEKVFGAKNRDPILAIYPARGFATPRAGFVKLTTDAEFTCQSRRVARTLQGAQNQKVYRYRFSHLLGQDPEQKARGATHTIEHAFLFAWHGTYKPGPLDAAIQSEMVGYWTQMAKTGDPNVGPFHLAQWPAFTPKNDAFVDIGGHGDWQTGPADAHCDFWDGVTLPWPHL
jgi:para-nitrobenzyl esterase